MQQRPLFLLSLTLATALVVGCPSKPELPVFKSVAECQAQAEVEFEAAKAARASKDLDAADQAALSAEDALRQAKELAPASSPKPVASPAPSATPTIKEPTAEELAQAEALRKAGVAARGARRQALGGHEEKKRDAKLNGLVAKTYRKGSGIALKGLFLGLSKAAEQAVGKDVSELPENLQAPAQMAADLARDYSGRQPLPDGKPDWAGIASDMSALSEKPSARVHFGLAAGFLMLKRDRLALYEIHSVDPAELPGGGAERAAFMTLKGIVYRMNGYPVLAKETFESLTELPELAALPDILAGIHLLLMANCLKEKEYAKADEHLVRAIRLSPDNPVTVYLTGEQQLANGEVEQAQNSFEKAAAGTEAEWLSKEISTRVKDIQAGKDTGDALFTDLGFLRKLMVHHLAMAAKKSPEAKEALEKLERAQSFGTRTLEEFKQKIPGFGSANSEGADEEAKSK